MSLAPGTRLGPYEVLSKLGAGGMGEVYRARDTTLERDVAVKVLPPVFAENEERVARFEREAKLLASLNHPHIASIYGFESGALVLELVEGPTLAELIDKGPIPVDEAVAIAEQMAEALEAGHAAGVIHRDLKPANIKVKEDGSVKVLDYGLAKALEGEASSSADPALSQSPTLTRQGTELGVILGTAAYMSPEQAKGKRVDARTDVWAFGAVVYEMLTGKRAFAGEDVSDTLAAVLRAEPDLHALPAETPRAVRNVLRACLAKNAKERIRDIADVRLAMKGVFETPAELAQETHPRRMLPIATASLVAGAVLATFFVRGLSPEGPHEARHAMAFSIPLPDTAPETESRTFVVSRDGSRIAYVADERIYLRELDDVVARPLAGTEGGPRALFFSPDGEWLGFYRAGKLEKVALESGAVVSLAEMANGFDAEWMEDDTILIANRGRGVSRVPAGGGVQEVIVPRRDDEPMQTIQPLPGGRTLLGWTPREAVTSFQIEALSLETMERRALFDGKNPWYSPTGHLVYAVDETLFAVPFDVEALETTGTPVPVVTGVDTTPLYRSARFHISEGGTLVYAPARELDDRRLAWVDRDGSEELIEAEPHDYRYPRISPDGNRIAVHYERSIWTWDIGDKVWARLTFDEFPDANPSWTPDGSRVVFLSVRDDSGRMRPYWKPADGTGRIERLGETDVPGVPYGFTPDGKRLVFLTWNGVDNDVGTLSLEDGTEWVLEEPFGQFNAAISPDGAWMAYESNESGRLEVYVRPFPNAEDGRWLVSRDGGRKPLWSPDGRELFYLSPSGEMMATPVRTSPAFSPGNPVSLFRGDYFLGAAARNYDISPDGKRFLMVKESPSARNELIVVVNWLDELERLVPTH